MNVSLSQDNAESEELPTRFLNEAKSKADRVCDGAVGLPNPRTFKPWVSVLWNSFNNAGTDEQTLLANSG